MEYDSQLDARGLRCPEPLMLVRNKIRELPDGNVLQVLATDPTTERDLMKHDYLKIDREGWQDDGSVLQIWIRKNG